jgi:hypothetical protein
MNRLRTLVSSAVLIFTSARTGNLQADSTTACAGRRKTAGCSTQVNAAGS